MLLNDYQDEFKEIFTTDQVFSRRFRDDLLRFAHNAHLPRKIMDNEGTNEDFKGHDVNESKIDLGLRVRRFEWLPYNDFSQDDKERDIMSCDYYIYGYADLYEKQLLAGIIFDYQDFLRVREKIKQKRNQNKKHSKVWATYYSLIDIERFCRIYNKFGYIANPDLKSNLFTSKIEFHPYQLT